MEMHRGIGEVEFQSSWAEDGPALNASLDRVKQQVHCGVRGIRVFWALVSVDHTLGILGFGHASHQLIIHSSTMNANSFILP